MNFLMEQRRPRNKNVPGKEMGLGIGAARTEERQTQDEKNMFSKAPRGECEK
jgi:hypothetical protein